MGRVSLPGQRRITRTARGSEGLTWMSSTYMEDSQDECSSNVPISCSGDVQKTFQTFFGDRLERRQNKLFGTSPEQCTGTPTMCIFGPHWPCGHACGGAYPHARFHVLLDRRQRCRNCEVGVRSRSASTARTADCWCRCASSSHLTRRAPGRDSAWPTTKPWYLPSSSTT